MASVNIVVTAQDKASGALRSVVAAFNDVGGAIKNIAAGGTIMQLGNMLKKFAQDSVASTVEYANQVRQLSLLSGQSTEEASKMIQVFDDFKISVDSLTPAFRKMTSEGLVPNLETIAKLSDEYVALEDPLARNAFLIEKFGRAGLNMAEAMSKGGDALLSMGESVDESLILTDEAVKSAREYEIALDDWNDAVKGLKTEIGTWLLPILTDAVNYTLAITEANRRATEEFRKSGETIGLTNPRWVERRNEILRTVQAEQSLAAQIKTTTANLNGQAAAAAAVDFKNIYSSVTTVQNAYDKLKEAEKQYAFHRDRVKYLMEDGGVVPPEMLDELHAAKVAYDEARAANELWAKQFILSTLQVQMAAEGGLTGEEFATLMSVGEALGLIDADVAEATKRVIDAISDASPEGIEEALAAMQELFAYDGKTINVTVNTINTSSSGGTSGTSGGAAQGQAGGGTFDVPYGYPNDSYLVGLSSGEQVTVVNRHQQREGAGTAIHNHYYYGAKIMLERGAEDEILARLTE